MKLRNGMWMVMLVFLMTCGDARAHRVNLFAYVEGGTVCTESYFPDGRPVQAGKVEVYDSQKALLVEGATDPEGVFCFPVPKVDDLNIVLDASMGHRAGFQLKKSAVEAGR